jgi:hypothetical protein
METSIYYGKEDKQLCFNLREKVTTKGGFELKGKGRFNTVTGGVAYRAHAMKVLTVGPEVKDAGSKPFTLGETPACVERSRRDVTRTRRAPIAIHPCP